MYMAIFSFLTPMSEAKASDGLAHLLKQQTLKKMVIKNGDFLEPLAALLCFYIFRLHNLE